MTTGAGWFRGAGLVGALATVLALFAVAPPGKAQTFSGAGPSAREDLVPGEFVVRLNAGGSNAEARETIVGAGARVDQRLLLSRTFKVSSVGQGTVSSLDRDPTVKWVEPVRILRVDRTTPSDPSFVQQPNLEAISAPEAWDRTTGSAQTRIGILDTGVDLDHPDLVGALEPGKDFTQETDGTPDDANGHGTHVAGIAAARTNNGIGIAGVAWAPRIVPLQACYSSGSCYNFEIHNALIWAGEHDVDIVNMSLGAYYKDRGIRDSIAAFPQMTVVASAGNDGRSLDATAYDPCTASSRLDNVICVAATGSDGALAPFSNFGKDVSTAAPGRGILSTYRGGGYVSLSGTSMAAPHVTGAVALLAASHPTLGPAGIRAALEQGEHSPSLITDRRIGSGSRMNLVAALDFLDRRGEEVANREPPLTTGAPSLGHNLEAWPGQWTGALEGISFQWERETASGFEPIPEATGRIYRPVAQDAGLRLRTRVTATGRGPVVSASSPPTDPISGEEPRQMAVEEAAYASITGAGGMETIQDIVPLGDVDDDGHPDLAVVECDEWDFHCGEVEVLLGPIRGDVDLGGLDGRRSFTVATTAQGYFAPQISVSGLEDFNGDGIDDFVISEDSPSRAYVIFGHPDPRDLDLERPDPDRVITVQGARSPNPYDSPHPIYFQYGAFGPGDTNGDGLGDLVIRSVLPVEEPGNPAYIDAYASRTFVLFGGPSVANTVIEPELSATRGRMIDGIGDFPREQVGGAGDFNGDGLADLIFRSPAQSEEIAAATSVVYGGGPPQVDLTDLAPDEGWVVSGVDSPWLAPPVGSGAADDDGRDDLIVGTYDFEEPSTSYVVPFPSDGRWIDLKGEDEGYGTALVGLNAEYSGSSVELADIDGDGVDTPVVGQPGSAGLSRGLAGSVAVLAAPADEGVVGLSGLTPPHGIELLGEHGGSSLGSDAYGRNIEAVDLDGNGSDELVLLAVRAERDDEPEAGRAYLVSWARDGVTPQKPPRASISGPSSAEVGETVEVRLDNAVDDEGEIEGVEWDLDGDGEFEQVGGESHEVTYELPGTKRIEVRVSDAEGAYGYASLRVTVTKPPPVDEPDDPGDDPSGVPPVPPPSPPSVYPDTSAPQVRFLSTPTRKTNRRKAKFEMRADERVSFRCRLDGRNWQSCGREVKLQELKLGKHVFRVRAIDDAGNRGEPILHRWKVKRRRG